MKNPANRKFFWTVFVTAAVSFATAAAAAAAEPAIADYTAYPMTTSSQVRPNIMVLMDNSGSMNYNAYGIFNGSGKLVTGDDYRCGNLDIRVHQSEDDAEERGVAGAVTYMYNDDLDLGSFSLTDPDGDLTFDVGSGPSVEGIRFQNLNIPRYATITRAYIEFEAYGDSSYTREVTDPVTLVTTTYTYGTPPADTELVIVAQDTDDPDLYAAAANDIASRSTIAPSVTWSDIPHWTAGTKYRTPELKSLVQAIVDRDGWAQGGSIAFALTGKGKRDARSYDFGDNTHGPVLHVEFAGCQQYYGYFDPDSNYSYASSVFSRDSSGPWSGNFLNWMTMRRIDVARKVLMGGLATPRTYTGTQKLYGENSPANRAFTKSMDGTGTTGITPYTGGVFTYEVDGGNFTVRNSSGVSQGTFSIVVKKDAAEEPGDFEDLGDGPTTVGVFQRYGDAARWGNMWFNNNGYDGINNGNGGVISNPIQDTLSSDLLNDLQNTDPTTWTPLAEAYYTAVMYFAQDAIDGGLNYSNNPGTTLKDPFDGSAYCAKNFVLLITDGASTMDARIPSAIKDLSDGFDLFTDGDEVAGDCDEESGSGCEYPGAGTDYLKDVAYWARTTDLRPDGDADGLKELQNVIIYPVYAFGNEPAARKLLKEAAKNGAFIDKDGSNTPNQQAEWDKDGDGVPDTYFEASNGSELQKELADAISSILERAASGTAASVLATNSSGEGNLIQAYYRPKISTYTSHDSVSPMEMTWNGYLQSLWVDPCGNLREDSNGNKKLDLEGGADKIVEYWFDESSADTKMRYYTAHPQYTDPYNCSAGGGTAFDSDYDMDDIVPLFESGRLLALTDPKDRRIFTYIDGNEDGVVDEPAYNGFDWAGEAISFDQASSALLAPYLGVADGTTWNYLGSSHAQRLDRLIRYIRGEDFFENGKPVLRNRSTNELTGLDGGTDAMVDHVWKLGDIVSSTPISVSRPSDNYHIIYSDKSYQTYLDAVKNRETMVYVGANDGMLHAFTSWKYNRTTGGYESPDPSNYDAGDPTLQMGSEAWAYIPQALLPHLKFLADPDYTHVFYVDLKPKVFDAKILAPGTHYGSGLEKNWGTFLLVGLNLGGRQIWTNEFGGAGTATRYFSPSYALIDVTEPRNPVLMWERNYSGLGLGTSTPAIVKVEDKWLAVFGSGPTTYHGTSTQQAKIFVVDLATGAPYSTGSDDWLFELAENYSFINSPASLDKNLNYNVDAIYFGETHCASATCESPKTFEGKLYKLTVPCDPCDWTSPGVDPQYEDGPALWASPEVLFDAERPITAPVSLSVDSDDNAWIYFGTGRYLREQDKTSQDQEYLYGIKDPFFNKNHESDGYYRNFNNSLTLDQGDLFNAESVSVTDDGLAFHESTGTPYGGNGSFYDMLSDAMEKDGWYRSLETSSGPSERSISKNSLLGGILLAPTFTPNSDICGFGGHTNFYGLYFQTGTAFHNHVFDWDGTNITYDGQSHEKVSVKFSSTSIGAPPPAVGIHAGRQEGAKAYLQLSTGEIKGIDTNPAFNIKSGLNSWREPQID